MNRKQKESLGLLPSIIEKVIYLGDVPEYKGRADVHCVITYKDGKLSISGVVGAKANGNCDGSCGQMYDTISDNLETFNFAQEWDKVKAFQFVEYWKEWHLNDMVAGTPEQEQFVKEWKKTNKYDYTEVLNALTEAKLNPFNGYVYGSAWLTKEIPDEVIKFLNGLPEASKPCKWNLLK